MKAVVEVLGRVASSTCTVLVTGESGTGKEVVVRALHDASPRKNRPLVAVNCGAIPENLIESELFGHAKGAFTGATSARRGYIGEAEGGTLFLDEVGELSLNAQVKLLRLLQQREYTPVGESRSMRADVRVVAATNRDLEAEVARGAFREDLFWRLEVIRVHLPPLRERREDIRPLARHFLAVCAERAGRPHVDAFAPDVLDILERDEWPGNVRALENAIERAVVLARGTTVEADCLPARILARAAARESAPPPSLGDGILDLRAQVEALETRLIKKALDRANNNKQRAADLLGLKRTTLVEMMKRRRLAA